MGLESAMLLLKRATAGLRKQYGTRTTNALFHGATQSCLGIACKIVHFGEQYNW